MSLAPCLNLPAAVVSTAKRGLIAGSAAKQWHPSFSTTTVKHPVPPFTTRESAVQKVRMAEDAWNSRDVARVASAYSPNSVWRNRSQFFTGNAAIQEFLREKWSLEQDYRLIKELWAFHENRIAVRFCYEYYRSPFENGSASPDQSGQWFRAYGNENWQFNENGFMTYRHASINDVPIREEDRLFRWDRNDDSRRPDNHPGLSDLGL
jgi:uncharacterized protein